MSAEQDYSGDGTLDIEKWIAAEIEKAKRLGISFWPWPDEPHVTEPWGEK